MFNFKNKLNPDLTNYYILKVFQGKSIFFQKSIV